MDISTNSSYYSNLASTLTDSSAGKAGTLQETIKNLNTNAASAEEDKKLMDACKGFESYFVQQVFKEMKKTVHSSDDENEYMQYFGDTMLENVSETISDSGEIGLAQMLYESMKKN